MRQIDIIILSNSVNENLKTITENCLLSLFHSEDREQIKFNVLVIESNRNLKPFIFKETETFYPSDNFNFNKYLNIGLKWSKSEYVCFCNNDLIFQPLWASKMLEAFTIDRFLMSASPVCDVFHPTINISINSGNLYGYDIRREIAGWCIFVRRELFNVIGEFDEHFKFWFADSDYAKALQKYNQKHALITTSIVTHLDGMSTKMLSEKMKKALTSEQFWYFQYKWEHHNKFIYWYRKLRSWLRIIDTEDN